MDIWVYMLQCSDGSFYVGSARYSLDRRIAQHQSGELGGYTSTRRPVELVWSADFQFATDAIACERQLKGWSRAKKKALIEGDYAEVSRLAHRRRSSFETAAARPPQDEEYSISPHQQTRKAQNIRPHP
jgi:predicted GIY-YIG superfamily endonuclease